MSASPSVVVPMKKAKTSTAIRRSGPFAWVTAGDLAERPAPAVPWLVPELHIAPGRPMLVYGLGGTGKTLVMVQAAIAIASGLPVWGRFDATTKCAARLIDLDVGPVATELRTRVIAAGLDVDLDDLGDDFASTSFPNFNLGQADAEDVLAAALEGAGFAVIDALRGATRGMDENDSRVRDRLDVLSRVSARTGCAIALIHHAGKAGGLRGSSAIWDASGAVFRVEGDEGEPKTLTHEKPSEFGHGLVRPITLDIAGDDHHVRVETIAGGSQRRPLAAAPVDERVIALLREHAEGLTENKLVDLLETNPQSVRKALERLGASKVVGHSARLIRGIRRTVFTLGKGGRGGR